MKAGLRRAEAGTKNGPDFCPEQGRRAMGPARGGEQVPQAVAESEGRARSGSIQVQEYASENQSGLGDMTRRGGTRRGTTFESWKESSINPLTRGETVTRHWQNGGD